MLVWERDTLRFFDSIICSSNIPEPHVREREEIRCLWDDGCTYIYRWRRGANLLGLAMWD